MKIKYHHTSFHSPHVFFFNRSSSSFLYLIIHSTLHNSSLSLPNLKEDFIYMCLAGERNDDEEEEKNYLFATSIALLSSANDGGRKKFYLMREIERELTHTHKL